MARAKLSSILQSLTGRFGGGVFRNWKGITVLAALQDSVRNPNTAQQVKYREILGYASKQWALLTGVKRAGWAAVADYLSSQWEHFDNETGTRMVIRPPRGPYTALGALCSNLALLGSVDEWDSSDAVPDPPVAASGPTQPLDVALSGNTGGLIIAWTAAAFDGDLATTHWTRVWITAEDGTFFSQLATFKAKAVETATITVLRASGSGQETALQPGWYHVQLDAVNDLGLRGAPSAVASINLPRPA